MDGNTWLSDEEDDGGIPEGAMIEQRLADVIRRIIRNPDLVIDDDTQAFNVPGWDSLKHVEILLAVQDEYKIRIRPIEAIKLKKVGDLQNLVRVKCGSIE